jgi:DNA polymerase III sliding clamp (beta) subunit (PCNA family)
MSVDNGNMELCLLTENKKEIQAETSMDVNQKGENIYLGANINYLYEAVNLCTTKNITMEIRGTSCPVTLLCDFYYLLMPIALRD